MANVEIKSYGCLYELEIEPDNEEMAMLIAEHMSRIHTHYGELEVIETYALPEDECLTHDK